jgi:hypothetical protein
MKALNNRPQCTSYGTLGPLCLEASSLARYRCAYERKFTSSRIPVAGCGWDGSTRTDTDAVVGTACASFRRIDSPISFSWGQFRKAKKLIIFAGQEVASIPHILSLFRILKISAEATAMKLNSSLQLIANEVIYWMRQIPIWTDVADATVDNAGINEEKMHGRQSIQYAIRADCIPIVGLINVEPTARKGICSMKRIRLFAKMASGGAVCARKHLSEPELESEGK